MKQDNMFFGEEGLTTTSADFIANLAKEMLHKDNEKIENCSFVCEQISPYNNPGKAEISLGMEEAEVREIPAIMERILHLKLLISWLREAIKAKGRLLKDVEEMEIGSLKWHELGFAKVPSYPLLEREMTKEDYMGTLSIADRSKMYKLQTRAAVLGKILHKDGTFERARERLYACMTKSREVEHLGSGNIIHNYKPSVDSDIVDEVYFKLSTEYRESQAGLNAYLHDMDAALKQSKIDKAIRYSKGVEEHNQKYNQLSSQLSEWKSKETKRINKLKIIIPDSLRDIYEEVQRVG